MYLCVPLSERASADRSQAALPESTGTAETILLVDDNEIVLDANSSVTLTRDGENLGVDVELGAIQLANRRMQAGSKLQFELGGIVVDVELPKTMQRAMDRLVALRAADP